MLLNLNLIEDITNVKLNDDLCDKVQSIYKPHYEDTQIKILNSYGPLGLMMIEESWFTEGDNNEFGFACFLAKKLIELFPDKVYNNRKKELNKILELDGRFWDMDTDEYVEMKVDEFFDFWKCSTFVGGMLVY